MKIQTKSKRNKLVKLKKVRRREIRLKKNWRKKVLKLRTTRRKHFRNQKNWSLCHLKRKDLRLVLAFLKILAITIPVKQKKDKNIYKKNDR